MRGGNGIRDRFLLLLADGTEPPTAEAVRRLAVSFPDIVEQRTLRGRGLALIRPDGYTAFSTRRRVSGSTLDTVRTFLSRQTGL